MKENKTAQAGVEVFIPRTDGNKEMNFFVGLNGTNYLLPRGKKSVVPEAVAEEIRRALDAQEKMFAAQDAMRMV